VAGLVDDVVVVAFGRALAGAAAGAARRPFQASPNLVPELEK
jgi:hypothetical protein